MKILDNSRRTKLALHLYVRCRLKTWSETRDSSKYVSNTIRICYSLGSGKIGIKTFVLMRRVHVNPRWRTEGRVLSKVARLVREGTDSSFPYIVLIVQNAWMIKSLPYTSCKCKAGKIEVKFFISFQPNEKKKKGKCGG